MASRLDVPDVVARKAEVNGQAEWLQALPDLVADLAERWQLQIGDVLDGGSEALVCAVADGSTDPARPAVLKLLVPRDEDLASQERRALELADGVGCAALYRADDGVGALLLERLGPSLSTYGLPLDERLDILADTAAAVWRPVPGADLPTGADKGRWLVDFVTDTWERLDRPCTEAAVAAALTAAETRIASHDDDRAVLVHGDVHQWNALSTGAGAGAVQWKLVDPDGLVAEPAYDLGILLREDPVELRTADPMARARRLAARTGHDATAIWEWGLVERVSTGLVCHELGLPDGVDMLATADWLATQSYG